jgi:hypothetical protein
MLHPRIAQALERKLWSYLLLCHRLPVVGFCDTQVLVDI